MDDQEEMKPVDPVEPFEPVAPDEPMDTVEVFDREEEDELEEPESGRSWLPMAAVGLAALVLGLFLGYVGRGQFGPEAQAAHATQTVTAGAVATQAAGNQELMNYLVGQSRHSKGPEDAKVTIIEFSDFQ